MKPLIRLAGLDLAGYRGAGTELSIPLGEPLNIIYGPNGSGKSTLLTAIEWALFPVEAVRLRDSGIDERRGWEIGHVGSGRRPEVTLTIDRDGEPVRIRRLGARGASGEESPLGCTYADFRSLAFVHQETLRDFLVGPPAPRQEAFSRLLGAGWLRDLAAACDHVRRELHCDEADQAVGTLETRLKGRMEEVHRLLDEERGRASAAGLEPPYEEAAKRLHAGIVRRIEELCRDAGVDVPPLPALEPLGECISGLAAALTGLRQTGPSGHLGELAARESRFRAARDSYREAQTALNASASKLDEVRRRTGPDEQIAERLASLEQERSELARKIAALDRKRAVVREAAAFFREAPDARECPVCDREVESTLADELLRHGEQAVTAAEAELRTQLDRVDGRIREQREESESRRQLSRDVERLRASLAGEREKLEGALGRAVSNHDDPLAVADLELGRLADEIAAARRAAEDWHRRIGAIQDDAAAMEHLRRIREHTDRVATLGAVRRSPSWRELIAQLHGLAVREQALRLAAHKVRELAASIARESLRGVEEPVRRFYSALTRRADFPDVIIDPERQFEVAVGDEEAIWPPTAVLNLTDMNCLALAIVAGMAVGLRESTGIGFLIFDDPSQGMDADVSARLGAMLGELAADMQVVVATPDRVLLDELCRSPRRKNVVRLAGRVPDEDTGVRIDSVEAGHG